MLTAEAEQMPVQRIAPEHLLHLQREAGEALAHVGDARHQPDVRA